MEQRVWTVNTHILLLTENGDEHRVVKFTVAKKARCSASARVRSWEET